MSLCCLLLGNAMGDIGASYSLVPKVEQLRIDSEAQDAAAAYEASCYYIHQDDAESRKKAWEYASKAAVLGSAAGAANLGVCYYEGIGVERDCAKALEWFEKSLQMGNTRVLNAISRLHAGGEGIPPNPEKALYYAEQALQHLVPYAATSLCLLYKGVYSVPRDIRKAEEILRKQIERYPEHGEAYYMLWMLDHEPENQDKENDIGLLKKAVDLGCPDAYGTLATCHRIGYGVEPDASRIEFLLRLAIQHDDSNPDWYYDLAMQMMENQTKEAYEGEYVSLIEKAAELGKSYLWLELVAAYHYGHGVEQDDVKAVECLQKAIEARIPTSLCIMGQFYTDGVGVEKDIEMACEYFSRSIEEDPECGAAYAELALCLLNYGSGEARIQEAFELAQAGAARGYLPAYSLLAQAYEGGWAFENGVRMPPDKAKAQEYREKAKQLEPAEGNTP